MNIQTDIAAVMRGLGLDEAELANRKDFLEFSAEDIDILRELHPGMEAERLDFADTFYRHLLSFPPLRGLIGDPSQLERLKQTQARYFSELSLGHYGMEYVTDRLRVGLVHQKIGLEPKWYMGAYRKYLSSLLPLLWRLCGGDAEKFLRACDAMLKIIIFDIGLALDTYFQADRRDLSESEERFRATFNQAAVGIAHVAPDGRWLRVNRKLCEIVDYSEAEMLVSTFQTMTYAGDLENDLELMRRMLAGEISSYSHEKRYIRKDGSLVWIELTMSLVRAEDGSPKYFISVLDDISARKRAEAQLSFLANHDALTALPNRNLMWDRLGQAIAFAQRDGRFVAVLFVDLDRFKNINDSLGHPVGDDVIVSIAERLVNCVRESDTVARLGGDEFAIVLADVARVEDVSRLATKILETLHEPVTIEGQELFVTASIGISLYPRDGQDAADLLKNADTAMYRAKEAGRDSFQFYQQDMNARALARLKMESNLRRALERREFFLVYQPQIDLASGRVVGLEALIRWQAASGEIVPPLDFIPLAEETGLIVPIGEWVLREACRQAGLWSQAGLPPVRLAVNLSARQFRHDVARLVGEVLGDAGCRHGQLELEITESAVMEHPEQSARILGDLTEMGVRVAIDDFGTGYSSLSYLKRFPIHVLKIDQSFVRDITTDQDDMAIARGVIALAHSMRLEVVAEGIEASEQLAFLRQHGCNLGQGYHFARPVRADEVPGLLGRSFFVDAGGRA